MANSINGITFDDWEGTLSGRRADAGEHPSSIRTGKLYGNFAAAYADLATWRSWPDPDTAYSVILPGNVTVDGCRIFSVNAEGLRAVSGDRVLLSVRWQILPPARWEPSE